MKERNKRKTEHGAVVSHSGDKSIKVAIDYLTRHPKYGKYIRRTTKLAVHDELNQAAVGDLVEVAQCRPVSRTKSWRLVRITKKAAGA